MRGVAQEPSELAAKMGWGRGRKRSWGEAARGLIFPPPYLLCASIQEET